MKKKALPGGQPGRTTEVHTMKKWHVIVLLLAVAVLAGSLGAYAAGTAAPRATR